MSEFRNTRQRPARVTCVRSTEGKLCFCLTGILALLVLACERVDGKKAVKSVAQLKIIPAKPHKPHDATKGGELLCVDIDRCV